jgi:hypothetical protein
MTTGQMHHLRQRPLVADAGNAPSPVGEGEKRWSSSFAPAS